MKLALYIIQISVLPLLLIMNASLSNRLNTWLGTNNLTKLPCALAVSGGADSVALLRSFVEIRKDRSEKHVVAHFNHRLRGKDSDEDEQFVRQLCEKLHLELEVGHWENTAKEGSEDRARKARYRYLQQVSEKHSLAFLVTAHTADDQVETILHHILRGTGISGLAGIASRRVMSNGVELVRPFLDVTRAEIENYLQKIDQNYRTDASNFECNQTRSKLRHNLLPLLRNEFNPQIDRALQRLGSQAAELEQFLRDYSGKILDAAVLDRQPEICRLDCSLLQTHPPLIVRECLNLLWEQQNWPRQHMGFEEWKKLSDLVQEAGTISLPHRVHAERRDRLLIFTKIEK